MTPARLSHRHRQNLKQFLRFGVVGASGVLVNMAVAVLMNKANGGTRNAQEIIWDIPGSQFNLRFSILVWIAGFLVANLTNFQLNRSWTFGSSRHASWVSEFWPFLLVGSVSAFVGIFAKVAMTNPTSALYMPEPWFHEDSGLRSREYWSQLVTIVLTTPVNFVVNKLWTFRAVRGHHPPVPLVAPVVAPELVDEDGTPLEEPQERTGR